MAHFSLEIINCVKNEERLLCTINFQFSSVATESMFGRIEDMIKLHEM